MLAPVKNDVDGVPRIFSIVLNRLLLVETVAVFRLLVNIGVNIRLLLLIDITLTTDISVDGVTVFAVVVIVACNVEVLIAVVSDADSFVDVTGFCNVLVVTSEIDNENYSSRLVDLLSGVKRALPRVLLDNEQSICEWNAKGKFEIKSEF